MIPSRSALTHSLTSRRAWRQVVEVLEPDLADGDVRLEERGDAACVRRGGGGLGVAAVQQHAHLVRVRVRVRVRVWVWVWVWVWVRARVGARVRPVPWLL